MSIYSTVKLTNAFIDINHVILITILSSKQNMYHYYCFPFTEETRIQVSRQLSFLSSNHSSSSALKLYILKRVQVLSQALLAPHHTDIRGTASVYQFIQCQENAAVSVITLCEIFLII